MSETRRGSYEVATEQMPVHHSHARVDKRPARPPLWSMKLLIIVVTVAVIAVSVVIAWQMANRSTGGAPTAARRGDCLTWPPGEAEHATRVDCADEHLFEVADSEPIPAAEADDQQVCARAVAYYLGSRYDPGGRFVIGAVRTGGRLVCGLQLPSDGLASVGFKGKVAKQDQSRVWPAGTCLGIRDGKTTDIAVDCGLPHSVEITGTADLSTVFGEAAPSTAGQDAVVRDDCGAATAAYLLPAALDATGLSMRYQPIDAAGWAAGSRRVACRIGSPKPDGGWAILVRSAKDGVSIDGQPPVTLPSPVEPTPAEVAAPTTETPDQSSSDEVPVRVDRESDESTATAEPVPHMAGPAVPGPVPVPGPSSAEPPADYGSSSTG